MLGLSVDCPSGSRSRRAAQLLRDIEMLSLDPRITDLALSLVRAALGAGVSIGKEGSEGQVGGAVGDEREGVYIHSREMRQLSITSR